MCRSPKGVADNTALGSKAAVDGATAATGPGPPSTAACAGHAPGSRCHCVGIVLL